MRTGSRNLVPAAVVLAVGFVAASLVLAAGVWLALDRAMARFESAVGDHAAALREAGNQVGAPVGQSVRDLAVAVQDHSESVTQAGQQIGPPVQQSIGGLSTAVLQHSKAVTDAGQTIARPEVRMVDPVEVKEPVTIQGPREDGSLPVDAGLGK